MRFPRWPWALFGLLLLSSCIIRLEPPGSGMVVDAETGAPLAGVAVTKQLSSTCYLPPNPGGPNSSNMGGVRAVTDETGHYRLPFRVFLTPPLWCSISRDTYYHKPGYFRGRTDQLPYYYRPGYFRELADRLARKTHRSHFVVQQRGYSRHPLSEIELREAALTANLQFRPTDQEGIFVHLPGRRLDRLHPFTWNRNYLMAHDAATGQWLILDTHGQINSQHVSDLPEGPFPIAVNEKPSIIFAAHNAFYSRRFPPSAMVDGVPGTVAPAKGGITAAAGGTYSYHPFATIEGDGKFICTYKIVYRNDVEIPEIDKVFDAADILPKEEGRTARFTHLLGSRPLALLRSESGWHLLRHDSQEGNFRRRAFFPPSESITAGVCGRDFCFLAFEGVGVRTFSSGSDGLHTVGSKLTEATRDIRVLSMVEIFENGKDMLYLADGGDRLWRFFTDGTPDQLVAFDPASIPADWSTRPLPKKSPEEIRVIRVEPPKPQYHSIAPEPAILRPSQPEGIEEADAP